MQAAHNSPRSLRSAPALAQAAAATVHTTSLLRRALPALLACSLLIALPAASPAQSAPPAASVSGTATPDTSPLEGRIIKKVEVVGNARTPVKAITDQVRAQPGQAYARSLVDVDVKTIASTDLFITVRADVIPTEDGQVIVRYVVEERPIVQSVEIVGNRKFKDEQIREALVVRPGQGVDPFGLQTDTKTIIDMYRKQGFAQTSVDVDKELLKQGVVHYKIIEGPRSFIDKIKFNGNANIKSDRLKWKISTKTHFWFFRKGVLDDDMLQADLVTIRDQYLKRGFLDARVAYSLEYSEDKRNLVVRFIINEGPRYKVGKMLVRGNEVFKTEELLQDNKLNPGDFAERDRINALQKKVEDRYGHEGYIYSNIEITPSYTDVPGVVDLNINITEGKPYLVGRVIVRGNPNIQDRVIRRQVRIYPDQTYDSVLVKKSVDRLKAVHIFQDVKITPIGDSPDTRDALVEAAEGQTGKFLIGAGVSTNSGLVGQISLEQSNFDISNPPRSMGEFLRGQAWKGSGQFFRILLEPGTEFQRYRVTFEEPYLFDTPYSFSNDAFFFTRSRESWNERRIGDIVTFGRRFGDIWAASLAFRAEQVTISSPQDIYDNRITDVNVPLFDGFGNIVDYANDSAQQVLDQEGSHLITSVKPGITRDTTDSRVFPTTGTRSGLSWEQYGGIGGTLTMSKFVAKFDWFYPIYSDLFDRKTIFSLRNEVGVIAFGDSVFYERFYGGGIGSLRGFKFRGVSPRSGPLNDPIGGDLSWITTGEVNYPIWEEILRGVVFVDVGDVESDVTIRDIRADFGTGLRVTIPFFGQLPLAIDFAVPVMKKTGDKTQIISFSLGLPF